VQLCSEGFVEVLLPDAELVVGSCVVHWGV